AAASFVAPAPTHPIAFLEIGNSTRDEAELIALHERTPFSVTSWHSMYDQPVIEEFVLDGRCHIVLKSVSSPSAAVREYLGITSVAVTMSLFHLYAAQVIIPPRILLASYVTFVLFLCFLLFPSAKRFRDLVQCVDLALSVLGVAVIVYLLIDFDAFIERAVSP